MMRNPDVMATVLDDEIVLLDARTGEMFTLNETGAIVWETVELGLDAICERVCAEFDIDAESARTDVDELVTELLQRGLIQES
jgi:PqqD family protein of HPr-rel-A system